MIAHSMALFTLPIPHLACTLTTNLQTAIAKLSVRLQTMEVAVVQFAQIRLVTCYPYTMLVFMNNSRVSQ